MGSFYIDADAEYFLDGDADNLRVVDHTGHKTVWNINKLIEEPPALFRTKKLAQLVVRDLLKVCAHCDRWSVKAEMGTPYDADEDPHRLCPECLSDMSSRFKTVVAVSPLKSSDGILFAQGKTYGQDTVQIFYDPRENDLVYNDGAQIWRELLPQDQIAPDPELIEAFDNAFAPCDRCDKQTLKTDLATLSPKNSELFCQECRAKIADETRDGGGRGR